MLIRSYLYAPANRADLLAKVATRGADAVIVDLEDSVPAAEKAAARVAAAAYLDALDAANAPPVYVRVNAGAIGLADVAGLPVGKLAGVRVPKAEDPDLIRRFDALLREREGDGRRTLLHPMIESVCGLYLLDELARASGRVERFIFGAGDYVHDIGGEATAERFETLYARGRLVARSRHLGLAAPIAHVYTPIADLEGLARACREDRALGYYGRSCIHPTQIATINAAFSPGPREIARAQAMVDGYQAAMRQGRGSVVIADGTFVDEAGFKRAQRVLNLASLHRPRTEG